MFLRPQNITKHALYGYFGPLFPLTIGISAQNRTQLSCYYRDEKLADLRPLRLIIFSYEKTK